jgi:hypothetical protein
MQTLADMLKALHNAKPLPRAVLDEPALKLRAVDGSAKRPRRRRAAPRRSS